MSKLDIVHEDDHLLVINKTAGVVVNRSNTTTDKTLQDLVEEYLKFDYESYNDGTFTKRSGMVHRLDKNTSGVLLWAKEPSSMYNLMKQFKKREVQKEYKALVHGEVSPSSGTIRLPLGRTPQDKTKFGVVIGGKMSETSYKLEKVYYDKTKNSFSYVTLHPKTGRTHQLRVIMKHLGYPLVADTYYLSKKRASQDAEILDRHFLHAQTISLTHPHTREKVSYEAPLSADLQVVLENLKG